MKNKTLQLDMNTRWNSTLKMLKINLECKETILILFPFRSLEEEPPTTAVELKLFKAKITQSEWEESSEILSIAECI